MDWTPVLNAAGKLAPAALGLIPGVGPLAAAAGAVLGPALAEALGLDEGVSPEVVTSAITAQPDAAKQAIEDVVVRKANELGAAMADAQARMLADVNATARIELANESWFVRYARPFNIWVIGAVTGGYGVCLIAATAAAVVMKDSAALNILVSNAGVLGIALAPCGAVAGVSAWGRTKEKMNGVAGSLAAVVGAVAKARR